eukprot:5222012-Karenia_brevis.AAC.2
MAPIPPNLEPQWHQPLEFDASLASSWSLHLGALNSQKEKMFWMSFGIEFWTQLGPNLAQVGCNLDQLGPNLAPA